MFESKIVLGTQETKAEISKVRCSNSIREIIGYHLSLKIPYVQFDIDALIGQNLTSRLKIRVLIIACK